MRLKWFIFGLGTFLPGVFGLLARPTGGTDSARYCYSVWLRHLVMLHEQGMEFPSHVAELGPGDSLGIGLAALISGASSFVGLDVHRYAERDRNKVMFDELVELFTRREAIPMDGRNARIRPALDSYNFPHHILDDERLGRALEPKRISELRRALDSDLVDGPVRYVVPWSDGNQVKVGSLDMIIAQASLEYVEDLRGTYAAMAKWLRPSGFAALTIDYSAHHLSARWNEHWTYTDFLWLCLKGSQPHFLNRKTHSDHRGLIEKSGFEVLCADRKRRDSAITRDELAPSFKDMDSADFNTAGGYFIVRKK